MTETKKPKEKPILRHRILREVYKHYLDFEDYYKRTGNYIIEHKGITISFFDLKYGLDKLSKRKKEAFFYNVILDKKQEEVAEIMQVTCVTIGQYVEAACIKLAERYFSEENQP